jgi:uncharacterized protein
MWVIQGEPQDQKQRRPRRRTNAAPESRCEPACQRSVFRPSMLLVLASLSAAPMQELFGDESPLRRNVLVVTGGHGFDRPAFQEMLSAFRNLDITEARQHSGCEAYADASLKTCDVVLLYDMVQRATQEEKVAFLSLFDRGVGLVVVHHALVSHQNWSEYERIVGGKYPEDQRRPGMVTPQVGYLHDVDVPVHVIGKHPITFGLSDFVVHDEVYWGYRTDPNVTPLLSTSHPKSGNPLAWVRQEGKSRVVYIQPGNGPEIFADPNYRRLIEQSLRWAALGPPARESP